jgi:prepilin-type N-terminal cleavage/methylation domain-containing protein
MYKERGYSLIELIIVISIVVTIAAVSLPAYKQFTIPQALKNVSQQLKSDLRIVHNNAQNGVKNLGGNRVSWVLRVIGGQSYYEISGCAKTELFSACKNSSHNYQRKEIGKTFRIYPCTLPCTNYTAISGASLYFMPVDGTIEIYNNVDTILPDVTGNMPMALTTISFLIRSTEDTNKSSIITINSEGSINTN